jgi:hypothetical protein
MTDPEPPSPASDTAANPALFLGQAVANQSQRLFPLFESLVSVLAMEEAQATADRLAGAMETVARRAVADTLRSERAQPQGLPDPEEVSRILEAQVREGIDDLLRSDVLKEKIRAVASDAADRSLDASMERLMDQARQVTIQEVGQGIEGAWLTPAWRRAVEEIVRRAIPSVDRLAAEVTARVASEMQARVALLIQELKTHIAEPQVAPEALFDAVAQRLLPHIERVVRESLRDATEAHPKAVLEGLDPGGPLIQELAQLLDQRRHRHHRTR